MPTKKIEQLIAAECLGARVRILNRVVSGIFDDQLRPHGIRSSQLNILVVVATRGPIAPTAACRVLMLEKSTLSRDLERLVAHGWITATVTTGRNQQLEITDAGLKLIHDVEPAWALAQAETEEILGKGLSKDLLRVVAEGRLHPSEPN